MGTYKTINEHKGKYAYPLNASLNVRSGPGLTYSILANIKTGKKAGLLTSSYYFPGGIEKAWVKITLVDGSNQSAWVRIDVVKVVPRVPIEATITTPTAKDAQDIVTKLVESDQLVAKQLAVLAEMLGRTENMGQSLSNQKTVYETVLKQYEARQSALKNSTAIKVKSYASDALAWTKTKMDEGWDWLKQSFGFSGFGSISVGISVAIAAATIAVSGTVLYFVFKPKYDESQVNLKLLGETKKWIETLPIEVQTKVKADLEKQLDDAFNDGKTSGFFGGAMKIIKPLAIGVVTIIAVPKLIGMWNENNKKAS